jgi:glycosyltransferase involved in cell wall biosynthesis
MGVQLSVCICTFNRAESLRQTLDSMAALEDNSWDSSECLVIDNNCTDHTSAIVEEFRMRLPIRLIWEQRQGLSHARNRAVAESTGEFVVFTDDDVKVEAGWLVAIRRGFEIFPQAGYFGGRILPDWQGHPPGWLRGERLDLIDGLLVWYDLGYETLLMTLDDPIPFGACFGFRRGLFSKIGHFRADLGVRGKSTGRGEETEFLWRAKAAGEPGIYVGEALCWHKVNPARLRIRGLFRYGIESGRSFALTHGVPNKAALHRVPLHIVRGLRQLLKGRGDRFRQSVINAGIEIGIYHLRKSAARGAVQK